MSTRKNLKNTYGSSTSGSTIQDYIQEIVNLTSQVNQLDTQIASLKQQVRELKEDINDKTEQIAELEAEIQEKQQLKSQLQARIAELEEVIYEGSIIGVGTNTNAVEIGQFITKGGLFYQRQDVGEWYGSLPALTDNRDGSGHGFFQESSITGFYGVLTSLTSGHYMFYGCSSLETFESDMPVLSDAEGMFSGCKLDKDSVENIVDSVPVSQGGEITIGYDSTLITQQEEDAYNAALVNKGWTVSWERN